MKNVQHPTPNIQRPVPLDPRIHWMFGVGRRLLNVPRTVLIFAIRAYQLTISPALVLLFGGVAGCRFTPTCSQYATDAIRARGVLAGGALAVGRICRCHPWGGCGHDPAPEKQDEVRHPEFGI